MPVYDHGSRYLCRPINWGFAESKEKKTPYFFMVFAILGKINPQDPTGELIEAPQGERNCDFYLTDKTVEYTKRDLEHMGFRGAFLDLDPDSPNAFDFSTLELTFRCEHEANGDKTYERWRYDAGRGNGGNKEKLDKQKMAQLNALFGRQFASLAKPKQPAGNGRGPAPAPQQSAAQRAINSIAPPSDNDIPF